MNADMGLNRIVGYGIFAAFEAIGEDATNMTPGQNFVLRLLEPCGDCPARSAASGRIICTASLLILQGGITVPAYAALKGGSAG